MSTEALLKAVETLNTSVTQQNDNISKLLTPDPQGRQNGPFIRNGESILSSRGYQLSRVVGQKSNKLSADHCKVERELHDRLSKAMNSVGFSYRTEADSILVPFSSAHLQTMVDGDQNLATEVRALMQAGVAGYDRQEVNHYRNNPNYVNRALSWNDELSGGALVGPAQMGELIELFRNNEVFMRAGARVYPMPANGRFVYPRQTGAATAYWVGEAQTITTSNQTTGDVVLTAKKLGVNTLIPNELFRFASVSVEQFVREDLMKVAALAADLAFLESVGSAVKPKGVINYSNINAFTAGVTTTDGDYFQPEDVLNMMGTVEEQNARFNGWVMRPLMYAALANRRADATNAGDGKGMFLFNMDRTLQEGHDVTRDGVGQLGTKPVYKSTQVSNTRAKGSATNLSYILGGDFSDFMIVMSGVLELMVNPYGTNGWSTDQTEIRGILFTDGAPRHEKSFVLCDTLVVG